MGLYTHGLNILQQPHPLITKDKGYFCNFTASIGLRRIAFILGWRDLQSGMNFWVAKDKMIRKRYKATHQIQAFSLLDPYGGDDLPSLYLVRWP